MHALALLRRRRIRITPRLAAATAGLAAPLLVAACGSPGTTPPHAALGVAGASAPATTAEADPELDRLTALMTGTFDSADQAARRPGDFLEIRLVMLPIWTSRADGRWLYVEQAAMSSRERPYRQRVYRVHRDDAGRLRSDVYVLPGDPLDLAAAWQRPGAFDALSPDDLVLREGCSIVLEPGGDDAFTGATAGTGCASTIGGAAYATSEVVIEPGLLVSWDRGWTADGEQAWGSTAGGYEFVRRTTGPPAE